MTVWIGWLGLVVASIAPGSVGDVAASDSGESRALVRAFVATLDEAEREATVLPWDHAARKKWYPSPGPRRPGLYVAAMSERQRIALHRVLRSVLSTQGYLSASFVMLNQDLIAKRFPGEDENSGKYSFAIYGDPSGDGLWSWRLGGHHLSLHFTYRGDRVVANTPLFLGTDVVSDPDSAVRSGLLVMGRRVEQGKRLVQALGGAAESCRLETAPRASIVANASKVGAADGGAVGEWPTPLRERLLRLTLEYVRDLDPSVADRHEAEVRAQRDTLRFAWSGVVKEGGEFYYRVTGRGVLFQLHFRDGHVHSMWSRGDDFGSGLADETGDR